MSRVHRDRKGELKKLQNAGWIVPALNAALAAMEEVAGMEQGWLTSITTFVGVSSPVKPQIGINHGFLVVDP